MIISILQKSLCVNFKITKYKNFWSCSGSPRWCKPSGTGDRSWHLRSHKSPHPVHFSASQGQTDDSCRPVSQGICRSRISPPSILLHFTTLPLHYSLSGKKNQSIIQCFFRFFVKKWSFCPLFMRKNQEFTGFSIDILKKRLYNDTNIFNFDC